MFQVQTYAHNLNGPKDDPRKNKLFIILREKVQSMIVQPEMTRDQSGLIILYTYFITDWFSIGLTAFLIGFYILFAFLVPELILKNVYCLCIGFFIGLYVREFIYELSKYKNTN